ncbi:MAG: glycosyltransferase family 4 protein [Candidatus Helarchaeota archaeon]
MKIAFMGIKGLPSKGGAERVVEAIVQRLGKQHEITVYCSSNYTPMDFKMPGVRIIRIMTLTGKHLHSFSHDLLSAFHAVIFGNYDLVHLHNIESSFVLPLLRLRYRVVATCHGRDVRKTGKWGYISALLMDMMKYPFLLLASIKTTVSKEVMNYFKKEHNRKIYYIPNGVDSQITLATERATNTLRMNGISERDNFIVFAAGRIIPIKGAHVLIKAFRKLKFDIKLVLIGDATQVPRYFKELQQMADNRVHFIPFITSRDELLAIVKKAQIFVFPSLGEAMSMMLLEAGRVKVPILCSDIPSNYEVLEDSAIYFKSNDPVDLSKKLYWALRHHDLVKQLGIKACKRIISKFSWEIITKRYNQLYRLAVK